MRTSNGERKRLYARLYYARHREKIIARQLRLYHATKDQRREIRRERARRFYNRHWLEEAARRAKYNATHPLTAAQRAARRAANREWRAVHPSYERDKYHSDPAYRLRVIQKVRRREAKLAEGSLTLQQWRAILAAHGGCCAYCGGAATEMDHVIPLSRGGRHDKDNIVPACRSCNARKHAKTPEEWRKDPRQ